MKICIVSTMTGFAWGGSEELWAEMAQAALDEGHEVSILIHPPVREPAAIERFRAAGIKVFHRARAIQRRISRGYERVIRPFPTLLRERPDVICISQGSAFNIGYDPELTRFVAQAGVPYVVVCQHAFDDKRSRPDHRSTVTRFLRGAARVAFVAEKNWRSVERQIAVDLPNGVVVRNPVNLDGPAMASRPDPGPVRFACVARLETEAKGQDVLFEILGSAAWERRDWVLRLYGAGPDFDWLTQLSRYHAIEERVEFRGHVADIRGVWSDNHMALFPSRSEGTPLALVEAMLCGRPAIVSDVGGNAEWVDDGRTGFVAEAPTGRSFGAAMERAWAAVNHWEAMGYEAHRFAATHADYAAGKTLLGLLEEAVVGSKQTGKQLVGSDLVG